MNDFLAYFLAYKYLLYIILLCVFVGIEIISKVPALLYTPLIAGTNAIHGIIIIGSVIILGQAKEDDVFSLVLGFIALILATINTIGGFVLTDRMLELLTKKETKK